MTPSVSVIIVTHNSQRYLPKCLDALEKQSYQAEEIIIVDCGSTTKTYLKPIRENDKIVLLESENIGFSRANNLGFKKIKNNTNFIVFINPDTFLSVDCIEKAIRILDENKDVGIVSGKLIGYDIEQDIATQRIDSAGIFRKKYGRWYDRGQHEFDKGQFADVEMVPALCGAFLFCRMTALKSLGSNIFDPDFFLYKEDIELSLRIRKKGWTLLYHPDLVVHHCRGWNARRINTPLDKRIMSASNEILLYKKHPSPYILWALLKFFMVKICKV